jgi:subtilisin family serine protease
LRIFKKNPWLFGVVPILLFALILGVFPCSASAQDQRNPAARERLRQKAWNGGSAMVIVHFRVPDINRLTAQSARFQTADESEAVAAERTSADQALRQAIDYAAWEVVTELQGTNFEEVARFEYVPFIALRVSPQALAVLETSPDVLGIEENSIQKLIDPIKDAEDTAKGEADNEGRAEPMLNDSTVLIGAKALWNIGITGAGWYVAILDTGIRSTHQFFTGKTIVEACRALGRDGNSGAGDCPNGQAIQNGPGSAVHYPNTYEGYDHGTHVAGIAAGNYGSLAGVAKGANILAVKIFSKFTASDCGGSPCVSAWTSDEIAGLNYVYSLRGTYNIAAVNMSLGGSTKYPTFCDGSSGTKAAIDLLRSAGIATAIATGNSYWCNGVSMPACTSSCVAVGSSTKSDAQSNFSNWDKTMQRLFAPGSSIYSSTGASDSSYESWNGTSMATPHVTGAWALMKQAIPTGSVTAFLNALQSTGKAIYSVCDHYGTAISRIQIDAAVSSLSAYTLSIETSAFGTTNPAPGVHGYPLNTTVPVTAVPNTYATFYNWTGDASGTANPVKVLIDRSKSIKANFKHIYPPAAAGEKVLNRSFSQAEYIDILTWTADTRNAALSIDHYNIYLMNGSTPTLLGAVDAADTQYMHRMAGADAQTYEITAVTSGGREGEPATVTVAAAQ